MMATVSWSHAPSELEGKILGKNNAAVREVGE
jgi:hypothetical protein